MEQVECKICSSVCKFNKNFTKFLALSETQCKVFSCENCKTSFLVGLVPHNIYSDEYFSVSGGEYSYEDQSANNCFHYRDICKKLSVLSENKEIIADVGCGLGHFMVEASSDFRCVEGYDGFADPEKFVANKDQLNVCDLDNFEISECRYDAISFNHSLEHVNDPVCLISQAFNGLKKGGVLYVEVPYQFHSFYDKLVSLLRPKKAPDFLSFHHRTFFTPLSLTLALQKEGFEIIRLTTFLPLRGSSRFRGLKGKLLYSFLWLSSIFDKGDYISVYAKKS